MKIFVGSKTNPSYLIETNKKKNISVYSPDNKNKKLKFYEKYVSGNKIFDATYDEIIFIQPPVLYKWCAVHVPKLIVRINNKYMLITPTKVLYLYKN